VVRIPQAVSTLTTTWQVTAPHLCAGLLVLDGRVLRTAPIVAYMRGWSLALVRAYCKRKGWTLTEVPC